jgi:hypothetical protein
MNVHLKPEERLSVLRAEDQFRRWNSLDDQRVCSVCERKFKGRQVEIRRFPGGKYKLYCPTLGCPSGPHQWIYAGMPLFSEIVNGDWWQAKKRQARPIKRRDWISRIGEP